MPEINWTQLVNPSYTAIFPELIVVGLMLVIMVADLYISNKRSLVWVTLVGIMFALYSVWFSATDKSLTGGPKDFFGGMIVADGYAFFLKAVLLLVAGLVTLSSVDYVEKYLKGMFIEFYEVILTATLGMMLMVGSRDLIAIYVGLELSSICSYVLAGLLRHDAKSNEAALKYFLNGALASAVVLFGASIIYGVTGTTHLPTVAHQLSELLKVHSAAFPLVMAGTTFLVAGFGFKVAAAPMHLWAPDAYEGAPTPVTGFFSVGPKGAAFGALIRIFTIGLSATGVTAMTDLSHRWSFMWAVLAAASMFVGNLTALMQSNVKRMMAYSSIAQAGYVIVGVVASASAGEAGSLGTAGVMYYVLAYALTNLGIFAVLTHLDQAGGWVTVSDFKGLASRNPFYAWSLLVCFISLIGIPPTVGFMGKFLLFRAAVGSGYLWLALVMAVNSAISVGYYYGIVKAMFLEESEQDPLPTSWGAFTTVLLSVAGVILVGILANPFFAYTQEAAKLLTK